MKNKFLTTDLQSKISDLFKEYVASYDSYGLSLNQRAVNDYEHIDGFIPFFKERLVFNTELLYGDFYKLREETRKEFSLDEYNEKEVNEDGDLENEPYITVMLSVALYDTKILSNKDKIVIDLWVDTSSCFDNNVEVEAKQYSYTTSIKKFDFEKVKEEVEKLLKQWF